MNAGVLKTRLGTPASAARPVRSLAEWLSPLELILGSWHQRVTQRHQLGMLDDHMLKDIGVDRWTARAEAAKPFWRP